MGRSIRTETLNALLPRCRKGEQEAFVEVYQLIGASPYGAALRLMKWPEEAEEAVQESFVKLFEKAGTIRSGYLSSWLHRVTINHCLDRLRSKGNRNEKLPDEMPGASRAGVETARSSRRLMRSQLSREPT